MAHRIFIVTIFALLGGSAFAQEKNNKPAIPPAAKEPESARVEVNPQTKIDDSVSRAINSFFSALQKNQIAAAYDDLTKGTKIAENPKDVATLKAKTQQAIEMFGDIRGAEWTSVQNVGTHLLRATYVSLGASFPLRWRFYFYRAADGWRLIDIRVDDRLADMFDEPEKAPAPSSR